MALKYRPEIDGLRAVAVVAVILYHARIDTAGVHPFSGGFIGVDVFFVISGFLITSIILREVRANTFTFAGFYERRARRILPALFTVMLASIPFAWTYLLPKGMKEFSGSVLSSLFFGSNVWFWREDSYVAEASALKPFLHTWSLSIEEQFYVIFPLALLLIWKYARRHIVAVFLSGFLLSLAASHLVSARFPDAGFYLLPMRGWELLAGALLARLELDRVRGSSTRLALAMPATGLLLIVASFALFDETTIHPSAWTLVPVVGTALVLWFGKRGEPVTELLSLRPVVYLGLISYSLYLWHFTVFAFARIRLGTALSPAALSICVLVSLALSALTFKFVETPFRNRERIKGTPFAAIVGTVFIGLVGAHGWIFAGNGLPGRLGSVATLVEEATRILPAQDGAPCRDRVVSASCLFENGGADISVTLIGDSHADALGGALLDYAEENGIAVRLITEGGCPLFPGTFRREHPAAKREHCLRKADAVRDLFESMTPSVIIYTAFLTHYLGHGGFADDTGVSVESRTGSVILEESPEDQHVEVAAAGQRMIRDWISFGHKVVVVYPIPEALAHVPEALARHVRSLNPDEDGYLRGDELASFDPGDWLGNHFNRARRGRDLYDGLPAHENLIRIDPSGIFCSEQTLRCATHDNAHLYYADDNHLSHHGGRRLIEALSEALKP